MTVLRDWAHTLPINQTEYTIQTRADRLPDGAIRHQYRVLLDGMELISWKDGDAKAIFDIKKHA